MFIRALLIFLCFLCRPVHPAPAAITVDLDGSGGASPLSLSIGGPPRTITVTLGAAPILPLFTLILTAAPGITFTPSGVLSWMAGDTVLTRVVTVSATATASYGTSAVSFSKGGAAASEYTPAPPDITAIVVIQMTTSSRNMSVYVNERYTLEVDARALPVGSQDTVALLYDMASPAIITVDPLQLVWTSTSPSTRQNITFSGNWIVGTTTLSFTVFGGTDVMRAPAPVTVVVKAVVGVAAVGSTSLVYPQGPALTITVTLAAVPVVGTSLTLTLSAVPGLEYGGNPVLTWAAGDNTTTRTVAVTAITIPGASYRTQSITFVKGGTASPQYVALSPLEVSIDAVKTVTCTAPRSGSFVMGVSYVVPCCISVAPSCEACIASLAITSLTTDVTFQPSSLEFRSNDSLCKNVYVSGASATGVLPVWVSFAVLGPAVVSPLSLIFVTPCTVNITSPTTSLSVEVGAVVDVTVTASCRPTSDLIVTITTGATWTLTPSSSSLTTTFAIPTRETSVIRVEITSLSGASRDEFQISGGVSIDVTVFPHPLSAYPILTTIYPTQNVTITLDKTGVEVSAVAFPLSAVTLLTQLPTFLLIPRVGYVGTVTIAFTVNASSLQYSTPGNVTVNILALKTIALSFSASPLVLFVGNPKNETITFALSASPEGGGDVVVSVQCPFFPPWAASLVSSSPKTLDIWAPPWSGAASSFLVSCTFSGTAAYQFSPPPPFLIVLDVARRVSCTMNQTTLAVGVTYPMTCCLTGLPTSGNVSFSMRMTRPLMATFVGMPIVWSSSPNTTTSCRNVSVVPLLAWGDDVTVVDAQRVSTYETVTSLRIVDKCAIIPTPSTLSAFVGEPVTVTFNFASTCVEEFRERAPSVVVAGKAAIEFASGGRNIATWNMPNVTFYSWTALRSTALLFNLSSIQPDYFFSVQTLEFAFKLSQVRVVVWSSPFTVYEGRSISIDISVSFSPRSSLLLTIAALATNGLVVATKNVVFSNTSGVLRTMVLAAQYGSRFTTMVNFQVLDYTNGYSPPPPVNVTVKPLEIVTFAGTHPTHLFLAETVSVTFHMTDPLALIAITPSVNPFGVCEFFPKALTSGNNRSMTFYIRGLQLVEGGHANVMYEVSGSDSYDTRFPIEVHYIKLFSSRTLTANFYQSMFTTNAARIKLHDGVTFFITSNIMFSTDCVSVYGQCINVTTNSTDPNGFMMVAASLFRVVRSSNGLRLNIALGPAPRGTYTPSCGSDRSAASTTRFS